MALAGVAGGVGVGVLAWAATGGGSRWVADRLEGAVGAATNGGALEIELLDLAFGLDTWTADLAGVTLRDAGGQALLTIRSAHVELGPWALLAGDVFLPVVEVRGAALAARIDDAGAVDWVALFASAEPPDPGAPPFEMPFGLEVRVDRLALDEVTGVVRDPAGERARLGPSSARGRVVAVGHTVDVSDLEATLPLEAPGPIGVGVWGGVQWDSVRGAYLRDLYVELGESAVWASGRAGGGRTDFVITVEALRAADVGVLVGHPLRGDLVGALTVRGPPDAIEVVGGLSAGEAGRLALAGRVDTTQEEVVWVATAELDGVAVHAIEPAVTQPVVLGGVLKLDGAGAAVNATWRSPRAVVWGYPVTDVSLGLVVDDGLLRLLPTSRFEGIAGRLGIGGSYDLGAGALAIDVEGILDPARLAALGAEGVGGAGTATARIRKAGSGEPVTVDGRVRFAPFRYGADVSVARLEAPYRVAVGDEVVVDLGLDGVGVGAYGLEAASLRGEGIRVVAGSGRVTVGGAVVTPGLAYPGLFAAAAPRTTFTVVNAGGHRDVRAETDVGAHELLGIPATGGAIATLVHDDEAAVAVRLDDRGRERLATDVRYDLAAAALEVPALRWAPTPRAVWEAREPVTLRLAEGGVADATVVLGSEVGRFAFHGDLALDGPLDAEVTLEGFELDHVTELFPDGAEIGGRLDLRAALHGTGAAPVVEGRLQVARLFAADQVRWLDVGGAFSWREGALLPDLEVGVVGRPLARIAGQVPLAGPLGAPALALDPPADLAIDLVPGALDRLALAFPAAAAADLPGARGSARVRVRGALRDPDLHVAGVLEGPIHGWSAPGRAEVRLDRIGARLTFDADLRQDLALRGIVTGGGATRMSELFAGLHGLGPAADTGDLALWLDDLGISGALVGVPADSLGRLVGAPVALGGDVVGGFSVTGSPTRPVVEGVLDWVDPVVAGEPFASASVAISPEPGGYRLDLDADLARSLGSAGAPRRGRGAEPDRAAPDPADRVPEGLSVHGRVPIVLDLDRELADWATGELALTVEPRRIPLRLLPALVPEVRDVSGAVVLSGEIGGRPDDPRPSLALSGEHLDLGLRSAGVACRDATLDVALEGRTLRIDAVVPTEPERAVRLEPLEGATDVLPGGQPRVVVHADVGLGSAGLGEVDLGVGFEDGPWLVSNRSARIRLGGRLEAKGTWPRLEVRGGRQGLSLVLGEVNVDFSEIAGAASLGLDPALSVTRAAAPSVARPEEPRPAYADFDVRVKLDLRRNLLVNAKMPFVDQLGTVGAAVSRVDLSARTGGQVDVVLDDGAPSLRGEVEILEGGSVRLLRSAFSLREGTVTFPGGDPYEDARLDLDAAMALTDGSTLDLRIGGTPSTPTFEITSEAYPDPTQQMVILLTGSAPDELTSDQGAGAENALRSLLLSSVLAGTRLGSFSIEPNGAVKLGIPVSQSIHATSMYLASTDPTVNSLSFEVDWAVFRHLVLNGGIGDRVSWGDLYWEQRF